MDLVPLSPRIPSGTVCRLTVCCHVCARRYVLRWDVAVVVPCQVCARGTKRRGFASTPSGCFEWNRLRGFRRKCQQVFDGSVWHRSVSAASCELSILALEKLWGYRHVFAMGNVMKCIEDGCSSSSSSQEKRLSRSRAPPKNTHASGACAGPTLQKGIGDNALSDRLVRNNRKQWVRDLHMLLPVSIWNLFSAAIRRPVHRCFQMLF